MFENCSNLFENPSYPSQQNASVPYSSNAAVPVQMPASQSWGYGYASSPVPMQTVPAGTVNSAPEVVIKASDLHSFLMMQAKLMRTCWENGAAVQSALDARDAASVVSESPAASPTGALNMDTCVGVYDRQGYGVFHNEAAIMDRMARFARFWDQRTLRQQRFASYPEALAFAKEGAARLTGRRADDLPNPRYDYNWKEHV